MQLSSSAFGYAGQYGTHKPGTCSSCNHIVGETNRAPSAMNNPINFNGGFLGKFFYNETRPVAFNNIRSTLNTFSSNCFVFSVKCGTYSKTYSIGVNISSFAMRVDGVTLDNSTIVF